MAGRVIYFEGTYVNTFSGNPEKTPRYDYNQIMYKLDLADERLALPVPVYRLPGKDKSSLLATRKHLPATGAGSIAFFALDRPAWGTIAVRQETDAAGEGRLVAVGAMETTRDAPSVAFYALPAGRENPPATTVPLYEFISDKGSKRFYSTDQTWSKPGYRQSDAPICRVWRNPMTVTLPANRLVMTGPTRR